MRNDPVVPKAVIRRLVDKRGEDKYFVIRWDLNPQQQRLMAVCDSLERADDLVRYDNQNLNGYWNGPPNPHPAG